MSTEKPECPGVLRGFPLSPDLYADDVRGILDTCLERYGEREWRAVVLTQEIHGHLGIYSALGAKMGLRAIELLEARGIHQEPSIVSYAGSIPPISCFNDGLQVSTGSTVGHGLFSVADDPVKRAEADFSAGGSVFTLRLREEYSRQIRSDIEKGTAVYGRSPAYWQYVRRLALGYWRDWDRKEIFAQ